MLKNHMNTKVDIKGEKGKPWLRTRPLRWHWFPPPPNVLGPKYEWRQRSRSSQGFRKGRSRGNLARTPDVAVVIPLKQVFGPSGKGAACWHVFFYMLTCDFLACYTPNMHVRKKAHVNIQSEFSMYVEIWTCMLTFSHVENFLHVASFFACCKFCMLQMSTCMLADVNM